MSKHGEERNIREYQQLVMNQIIDKKAKVVELSTTETYTVTEVYCAKCESWQEVDSRNSFTAVICPNCSVYW